MISNKNSYEVITKAKKGFFLVDLHEIWEYKELLFFLALRQIKVRYKQTIMGASWAVLNPFLTINGISLNVIEGIKEAKLRGAVTIGFTGASGGKLKVNIDYLLAVPSEDTPHIQESHIMIGHIICYLVEKELFGGQNDY